MPAGAAKSTEHGVLRLDALNALYPIDLAIERCHSLHVGQLCQSSQIGLSEVEPVDFVDLHGTQEQVMITGGDGRKSQQRARHHRNLRPRDFVKRLEDVHHFREHEIRQDQFM